MLTWPALATLKAALPNCEIQALVAPYTADMAEICPSIDAVQLAPNPNANIPALYNFAKQLRKQEYDAAITLFSTAHIGFILCMACIPFRMAPATKIAQLFYHKRVKQRRSLSEKPEYAYNQDLVLHYLEHLGIPKPTLPQPPYLSFDRQTLTKLKLHFCQSNSIATNAKLIFIHPGSGGSANNLSLEQYAQIGQNLRSTEGHHIVISAGPDEVEYAQQLHTLLKGIPRTLYHSTEGLVKFSQHIACADLLISGSTGPLHIAGTLNRPTAAFYPRRRSATALRWQTTNDNDKRLSFSPPESANEEDMTSIDTMHCAEKISKAFLLR